MKRSKKLLRTLSFVLLQTFVAQQISFADTLTPLVAKHELQSKPEVGLKFSDSVATIEDAYKNGGGKMFYLLQDAHTNESGQYNLANALGTILDKEKDLKYVFTEAGLGDDSISFLKPFRAKADRDLVARSYIKKGMLHGHEYLNLMSDRDFTIWGVENPVLYAQAVENYRQVAQERERFDMYLKKIEATTETLKNRLFNPSLQTFDNERNAYRQEKIALTAYFTALWREADLQNISLEAYPHLSLLKSLREKEEKIDFAKANTEHQKAIESLSKEAQAELKELTDSSQNKADKVLGSGQKETQAYFFALEEKMAGQKSAYPELAKYFEYLKLAKSVEAKEVLKEMDSLEGAVLETLARSEDEKTLIKCENILSSLKKLFHFTLTPEEYASYKEATRDFTIEHLTGFLNKKIMDLGAYYDRSLFLEKGYDETLKRAEGFYELTKTRDEFFIKTALEKMDKESAVKAALVAGGFHTANLKAILKDKGISYVSVTPQVWQATNMKKYESVLLSQTIQPVSMTAPVKAATAMTPMLVDAAANGNAGARLALSDLGNGNPLITGILARIEKARQRTAGWMVGESTGPNSRVSMNRAIGAVRDAMAELGDIRTNESGARLASTLAEGQNIAETLERVGHILDDNAKNEAQISERAGTPALRTFTRSDDPAILRTFLETTFGADSRFDISAAPDTIHQKTVVTVVAAQSGARLSTAATDESDLSLGVKDADVDTVLRYVPDMLEALRGQDADIRVNESPLLIELKDIIPTDEDDLAAALRDIERLRKQGKGNENRVTTFDVSVQNVDGHPTVSILLNDAQHYGARLANAGDPVAVAQVLSEGAEFLQPATLTDAQFAKKVSETRGFLAEERADGRFLRRLHTAEQIATVRPTVQMTQKITNYTARLFAHTARQKHMRNATTIANFGVDSAVMADAVVASAVPDGKVLRQDFINITDDVDPLFNDLVQNGYIDANGVPQKKFIDLPGAPGLTGLNEKFAKNTDEIYLIIMDRLYIRIEGIYNGGWAESMREGRSDQAKSPHQYLGKLPAEISVHFIRHAAAQEAALSNLSPAARAKYRPINYYVPIFADADEGHLKVKEMIGTMLTMGEEESLIGAVHIEDQAHGCKKCGHMSGKVLDGEDQWVRTLNNARFQLDVMGLRTMIVARTDAEAAEWITSTLSGNDQQFLLGVTDFQKAFQKVSDEEIAIAEKSGDAEAVKAVEAGLNSLKKLMQNPNDPSRIRPYHEVISDIRALGFEGTDLQRVHEYWMKAAGLVRLEEAIADAIRSNPDKVKFTEAQWNDFVNSIPRSTIYKKVDRLKLMKDKARQIGINVYTDAEWDILHTTSPETLKNGVSILWDFDLTKTEENSRTMWMIDSGLQMATSRSKAALPYTDFSWFEQHHPNIGEVKIWATALDKEAIRLLGEEDFYGILKKNQNKLKPEILKILDKYLAERPENPEYFLTALTQLKDLGLSKDQALDLINAVSRLKANNTSPSFVWPEAMSEVDHSKKMSDEEKRVFLKEQGKYVQFQFATYWGSMMAHIMTTLYTKGGVDQADLEMMSDILKNGYLRDGMLTVSRLQYLGRKYGSKFAQKSQDYAGTDLQAKRDAFANGQATVTAASGGKGDTMVIGGNTTLAPSSAVLAKFGQSLLNDAVLAKLEKSRPTISGARLAQGDNVEDVMHRYEQFLGRSRDIPVSLELVLPGDSKGTTIEFTNTADRHQERMDALRHTLETAKNPFTAQSGLDWFKISFFSGARLATVNYDNVDGDHLTKEVPEEVVAQGRDAVVDFIRQTDHFLARNEENVFINGKRLERGARLAATVDSITNNSVKQRVADLAAEVGIPLQNIVIPFQEDDAQIIDENAVTITPNSDPREIIAAYKDGKFVKTPQGLNFAGSNPADTARVEERTFFLSDDAHDAGHANRWRLTSDILPTIKAKMREAVAADLAKNPNKKYYLVPMQIGPDGADVSQVMLELTDNSYVVPNAIRLTRVTQAAWERVMRTGEFTPGLHITGDLSQIRRHPKGLEGEDDRYVTVVKTAKPDGTSDFAAYSYGSGYGGNALLNKKVFALRIAGLLGIKVGNMSPDHASTGYFMKNGRKFVFNYHAGSGTGKTTIVMSKWAKTMGDDIPLIEYRPEGAFVYSAETGMFAIMPGTDVIHNPNTKAAFGPDTNALFTNVALNVKTGASWWEGAGPKPNISTDPNSDDYWWMDWKGNLISERTAEQAADVFAQSNSRGSTGYENVPNIDMEMVNNPNGEKLSANIYGVRNLSDPLIAFIPSDDYVLGLLMGDTQMTETTSAMVGEIQTRFDGRAKKPFMTATEGVEAQHLLKNFEAIKPENRPVFAVANWYLKDENGKFLWEGYETNFRPLNWVADMEEGMKGKAFRTPAGLWIPVPDSFEGIDPRVIAWDPKRQLEIWERKEKYLNEDLQTDIDSGKPLPYRNPIPQEYFDRIAKIRKDITDYMNYQPGDPITDLINIIGDYTKSARDWAAKDWRAVKLAEAKHGELETILKALKDNQALPYNGTDVTHEEMIATIEALLKPTGARLAAIEPRNDAKVGDVVQAYPDIFSRQALDVIAKLAERFTAKRNQLMTDRNTLRMQRNQINLPPQFRKADELIPMGDGKTITVQNAREGRFTGKAVPADLQRQFVQMTGPANTLRSIVYALLSGADGWMADGEDALGQLDTTSLDNIRSLKKAIAKDQEFLDLAVQMAKEMDARGELNKTSAPEIWNDNSLTFEQKVYKQLDFTTKIYRARGLHLDDRQLKFNGQAIPASIVDAALYLVNNGDELIKNGSTPTLYLPKIQNYEQAALWNEMLSAIEKEMGWPEGTVRVFVLIEQVDAALQLMEIRAALGLHFVGFNTGRWDYIHSVTDAKLGDPNFIMDDITKVTMVYPFMAAYEKDVRIATNTQDAAGNTVLWVGGMEAQIPVGTPQAVQLAMDRAKAGKTREMQAGASGAWVAHWKMVPVVRPVWTDNLGGKQNLMTPSNERISYTPEHLAQFFELDPNKVITEQGIKDAISVDLQYVNAYLVNKAAVAIKPASEFNDDMKLFLMEDAATSEIRAGWLWELLNKGAVIHDGRFAGQTFNQAIFQQFLDEEFQLLVNETDAKKVFPETKTTTLPVAKYILQQYAETKFKAPWLIDLSNVALQVPDADQAKKNVDMYIANLNQGAGRITQNLQFSGARLATALQSISRFLGETEIDTFKSHLNSVKTMEEFAEIEKMISSRIVGLIGEKIVKAREDGLAIQSGQWDNSDELAKQDLEALVSSLLELDGQIEELELQRAQAVDARRQALLGLFGKTGSTAPFASKFDEAFFDQPLSLWEEKLGTRTYRALKNDNVATLGDLVSKSEAEILRVPNIGRKSLADLKELLASQGLHLGYFMDDWSAKRELEGAGARPGMVSKTAFPSIKYIIDLAFSTDESDLNVYVYSAGGFVKVTPSGEAIAIEQSQLPVNVLEVFRQENKSLGARLAGTERIVQQSRKFFADQYQNTNGFIEIFDASKKSLGVFRISDYANEADHAAKLNKLEADIRRVLGTANSSFTGLWDETENKATGKVPFYKVTLSGVPDADSGARLAKEMPLNLAGITAKINTHSTEYPQGTIDVMDTDFNRVLVSWDSDNRDLEKVMAAINRQANRLAPADTFNYFRWDVEGDALTIQAAQLTVSEAVGARLALVKSSQPAQVGARLRVVEKPVSSVAVSDISGARLSVFLGETAAASDLRPSEVKNIAILEKDLQKLLRFGVQWQDRAKGEVVATDLATGEKNVIQLAEIRRQKDGSVSGKVSILDLMMLYRSAKSAVDSDPELNAVLEEVAAVNAKTGLVIRPEAFGNILQDDSRLRVYLFELLKDLNEPFMKNVSLRFESPNDLLVQKARNVLDGLAAKNPAFAKVRGLLVNKFGEGVAVTEITSPKASNVRNGNFKVYMNPDADGPILYPTRYFVAVAHSGISSDNTIEFRLKDVAEKLLGFAITNIGEFKSVTLGNTTEIKVISAYALQPLLPVDYSIAVQFMRNMLQTLGQAA